jgi:hypothetical protein
MKNCPVCDKGLETEDVKCDCGYEYAEEVKAEKASPKKKV